jgi:multiple sugar transport system permease protein
MKECSIMSSSKLLSPEHVESARASSVRRVTHKWKRYSSRTFYLFAGPWLLGFVLLTVAPLLYALLVSFTNFDGLSGNWHWIGLQNYQSIFQNYQAILSLLRTLLYTLIVVPLSVGGGLGLAILLNQRIRAMGLFRTIFYLPSVVPVVASAIMWKLMFDTNNGPINALLQRLFNRFGYDSALLWILFVTILLVTILFFRTSALWVFYEVERE